MFTLFFLILIVLAAYALLWWGIGRLSLPEPVKVVVLVGLGLLALAYLYHTIPTGKMSLP